ncbi:hypothetical protein [Neisseria sp.]|nr:hypothetical protein [Neisseria sp.]
MSNKMNKKGRNSSYYSENPIDAVFVFGFEKIVKFEQPAQKH